MKKILTSIKVAILAAFSAVLNIAASRQEYVPRMALKQGGFVLLGRGYQGYSAGTIVELPASTEAALVAAGQASVSAGPPTTGNVAITANSGCAAIAAGQSSVTITNPAITVQSLVWAVVAQAAADGTLLRVERVVPAAGSVTIYGTAAATATTLIDWAILNPNGSFSSPQ